MTGLEVPAALALGGAVAGGLGAALKTKPKATQVPIYRPQQEQGLDDLLGQGLQNSNFDNIDARARKNFNTQTIPGIAERFTSMGNGGQRSSAFQGALGNAGADLESQLGAMRSQYGLQQLGFGLRPRFDTRFQGAEDNFASGALGGLSQGLTASAFSGLQGNLMGGGGGAMWGGDTGGGGNLGQALSRLQPGQIPSVISYLQSLQGGS